MNKRTNKPIYDVFPRKAPFFGRFLVDEVYPFGFAFIFHSALSLEQMNKA